MKCDCLVPAMLSLLCLLPTAQAGRFNGPEASFASRNQLQVLGMEIEQGSFTEAAGRIESILSEHLDELTSTDGDGLIGVAQVVDELCRKSRAGLTDEFDQKFGDSARAALQSVLDRPDHRPEELAYLARRYPVSAVGWRALVASAESSLQLGDVVTAVECFDLAVGRGWKPTPEQANRIEVSRRLTVPELNAPNRIFDATWYGTSSGFSAVKSYPVVCEDRTYVAGPRFLLALKPNGFLAWSSALAKPWIEQTIDQSLLDSGRGPLFQPVVVRGMNGEAQIILLRQPQAQNARGCVRAVRAFDGRQLWSTESDPALTILNFVGIPTAKGRFVYTLAVDATPRAANLYIIAQELTSGQILWRRLLGSVIGPEIVKDDWKSQDFQDFLRQGSVALAAERLLVAPNVGCVFCLGRFDGNILWSRPYPANKIDLKTLRRFRESRMSGKSGLPPLTETQIIRYNNTPALAGDVLMIAPQDTGSLLAYHLRTGKPLWEATPGQPMTLVGATPTAAILCGSILMAIDPRTGSERWRYDPAPLRLSGPAILEESDVIAPTTAGILCLSNETGEVIKSESTPASFRTISTSEAGKSALAGAGILGSFGIPEIPIPIKVPVPVKKVEVQGK